MKRHNPAADRNKDPICEVLARVFPNSGVVLEIASGSGQHVVHFAARFPDLTFQPTDATGDALASIRTWIEESGLTNVRAPLILDVTEGAWPIDGPGGLGVVDAVVCINMIHIAPWRCATALTTGAAARLGAGAPLVLYGPFMIDHRHTAPTNETFDAGLRARNPEWGVRDMGDLAEAAGTAGFDLAEKVPMPANNFTLVFRKR